MLSVDPINPDIKLLSETKQRIQTSGPRATCSVTGSRTVSLGRTRMENCAIRCELQTATLFLIKTKKRTQTKKINSESLLLAAQFIPSNKQFIQKADSEDDGTVTI